MSAGLRTRTATGQEVVRSDWRAARRGAGEVSVHLRNEDFFWHTFSIPALGVHLWVPVEGAGRITFDAVMRGELVVAP